MTGYNRLERLYDEEHVEQVEGSDELYKITHPRRGYDDETILIRFIQPDDDLDELETEDNRQLEVLFYDDEIPNQWNIQLFWAYPEEMDIDESRRTTFESNTRFAIRRFVAVDSLDAFLQPLQTVIRDLESMEVEFNRGELIQEILEADLGLLFETDSTNRDERLEKLRKGSDLEAGPTKPNLPTGPEGIIDSVELGPDFRRPASKRTLDAKPFTLLYGRNGSGKTSLLDAATLGMVGQVRGDTTQRSWKYRDLNVTLTGNGDGPVRLSNDTSDVADRISAWYGFRPERKATRHTEFYHVNYHEAGSTTRLAELDTDLDIEQTIRRSLYGEQLSKARSEKRELVKEADSRIEQEEKRIAELTAEIRELENKADRAENLFSTARAAREELSPGMRELIPNPPPRRHDDEGSGDSNEEWVHTWTTWGERVARLDESLKSVGLSSDEPKMPETLASELATERNRTETAIDKLEDIEEWQNKQKQLRELQKELNSTRWGEAPSTVAFVATILSTEKFDISDLHAIEKALSDEGPESEESLKKWRTRVTAVLKEELERLSEKREAIREISDLQERREELLDEIRSQTEEYLDITNEVAHCPACYVQQTEASIRNREQPEDLLSSESGVPDQLQADIEHIKNALEVLDRPTWALVTDKFENQFGDVCRAEDFWGVFERTSFESLPSVSDAHVTRFGEAIRQNPLWNLSGGEAIELVGNSHQEVTEKLESLEKSVEDFARPIDEVPKAIQRLKDRRIELEAGIQILEDHALGERQQNELRVAADRTVLHTAKSEFQSDAVVVESVAQINEQIEKKQTDLDHHQHRKEGYEDGIERLQTVFDKAGGDENLTAYVREHMSAITTLFQAFQRPYQFNEVQLNDDDEVRVIRRGKDDPKPEPITDMSSGQRAALALAIFVTNNLTHAHAPPVMLLDEPFAHLDDINTISFFNLLIELATGRDGEQDRQVIFATANEDIADLLERKIGDSPKFDRTPIDG
ncbi:SMC domain-containing protein [Halovivax asiaticus JCM 14624]|uniref:SMC domain-containing protein n=1 Tax=Halovivax asiaticus JCM 14624 TaxID=1227490 RepID=M0BNV5_9EURY|nr:AAA family ATPase [Halovivax asiaticus]ELZ12520.1 SMC domain-containing protein [Halovivax asiaticus JCM 14624]